MYNQSRYLQFQKTLDVSRGGQGDTGGTQKGPNCGCPPPLRVLLGPSQAPLYPLESTVKEMFLFHERLSEKKSGRQEWRLCLPIRQFLIMCVLQRGLTRHEGQEGPVGARKGQESPGLTCFRRRRLQEPASASLSRTCWGQAFMLEMWVLEVPQQMRKCHQTNALEITKAAAANGLAMDSNSSGGGRHGQWASPFFTDADLH